MTKRKVLIPLDNSPLSEQIIPIVKHLFSPHETELLLFSAVKPYIASGLPAALPGDVATFAVPLGSLTYGPDPDDLIEGGFSIEQEWVMECESELQPIATSLEKAGFTVRVAAWVDEPADAIITYARENKVDVIAMATHGRSGMSRLLLGSVAEAVVRQSHIPVLLLRPEAK